ncbi:MAG TPA: hypothetical protein VIP07_04410 [Candidatus Limnocylindria bacterium]
MKQPEQLPLCVSALLTTTLTRSAACAVVVPVIVVALIVPIVSGEPPNDTLAPAWNPVPAMLTEVPPTAGPLFGVTDVTVGAAT